ncbi:hypothetical protein [Streptococcus oriscaviae]|uniref:Cell wall-active antibiotics response LiaF-like C-terminal domain-containing protein n=1 Tax=Streptococcus oriscaviae TaxID=2781599 RepID=A0ABX7YJB2_9STRE|nr:hypothetical protein [Streptococcus oriscaviae]QUE53845.1 hypothetical protein INT76_08420 [Streptococcus oriscaviae]
MNLKKSYSWQIFLIIFAIYLILLAFFPGLDIIFNYFRLSLLFALAFLWLGAEHRNAILFFIGLAFSAFYVREITPHWYFDFNGAPLFLGLLVLGIAIHSINRKRRYKKLVDFDTMTDSTVISNDSNYLTVEANFSDKYEYSTAPALQSVSIKSFCANCRIDLSGATFENEVTYVTLNNSLSSCYIRLPRGYKVVNTLKSNFGEVTLPPTEEGRGQIYLTGNNFMGSLSIQYID